MEVVVVYESLFGNTRAIAEAVAAGIRSARPEISVVCAPVDDAVALDGADLVVVGGPTHAFGMTSRRTRASAAAMAEPGAPSGPAGTPGARRGVREWLAGLERPQHTARAAAFDTRMDRWYAGGAAPRIARGLRDRGYVVEGPPEGFFVEDTAGPLRPGERERAQAWGVELAEWAVPAAVG